ncbi:hypothetical protein GGP41_001318 [Bipolaris sorokiniana]|uniref:glucan 1,4-alpha-glucosidase n=1 Tax=Cochliobolus sativus TaxID=45130 RepID=A0A8H6DRE2_COCSA|nr:hypothetical protein GGP41_001318 [Bipolaris sorokiniana]
MLPRVFLLTGFVHHAYTLSIPRLPSLATFAASSRVQQQQPLQDTLDAWIKHEERIALDKLLANVAPGGSNVQGKGVAEGTVIASPSQDGPDYWFQWVRDAAITMDTLVNIYADDPSSSRASSLSIILDAYTSLQGDIQRTSNPSGTFDDLSGLGEPKFQVDGKPFTGSWGRPQRDGPALRALTLMHYLRDARSLKEGSHLARTFGDFGAADWYQKQAGYIENLLGKFWNAQKGHLVETLWSKRSGLDCGLLLGSLHALPKSRSEDDVVYPPWSDEILVSLLALTRDQRDRFPINSNPSDQDDDDDNIDEFTFQGTGLGRYPEDVYDGYGNSNRGGNPWFLCTSSAAEILYRTASHISATGNLTVTDVGLPFYESLLGSSSLDVDVGTFGPTDALFHSVIERLQSTGDEFLQVVKTHVDAEGSMSEQFDRVTGYMRGAQHLTWSYGAFLQAARARKISVH